MKKVISFIVFSLMLFGINVKAECSSEELSRLRELANNVEFVYEYKIETITDSSGVYFEPNFSITASNLNKELKVLIINDYYLNDYQEFKYNDSKAYTLKNFTNNERVDITIKGYVSNDCSGQTVLTKEVKLPYYNSLSDSEECEEYKDFPYCKRELENKISNSRFYSELEKYKKSLEKESDTKLRIEGEYVKITLIITGIIVGIVIVIIIINKIVKERKKSRL